MTTEMETLDTACQTAREYSRRDPNTIYFVWQTSAKVFSIAVLRQSPKKGVLCAAYKNGYFANEILIDE